MSDLRVVLMTWLDENFYQADDMAEEAERLERLLRRVYKHAMWDAEQEMDGWPDTRITRAILAALAEVEDTQ